MKILGIIQARMSSTRLPGKVLLRAGPWHIIELVYRRLLNCRMLDQIIMATSTDTSDDQLVQWAAAADCPCSRGSLDNVLERYHQAAEAFDASHIVRITADCPFIDPGVADRVVANYLSAYPCPDYASNTLERTYPRGLDVEVFTRSALRKADANAKLPHEREHVTPYLFEHPGEFTLLSVTGEEDHSRMRWTVDTEEDLAFVRSVMAHLKAPLSSSWQEIIEVLNKNPELTFINSGTIQKPYR